MRAILPNWEDDINGTGHTPSFFVRSQLSERLVSSLSIGESVLPHTMPSSSREHRRVGLVHEPPLTVEQEEFAIQQTPELVIETDSLLTGLGATAGIVQTGGP